MSYTFSDPRVRIPEEKLNEKERRVLDYLRRAIQPASIEEIARGVFPELPSQKAYFWAKNQLRRLFVARYVKQLARGVYQAAQRGA